MLQHLYDVYHSQTPSSHSHSSTQVVANGPRRRLRGGELAEHPGGELPEHFSSAWWNYLNADSGAGLPPQNQSCDSASTSNVCSETPTQQRINRHARRLHHRAKYTLWGLDAPIPS